MSFARPVVLLVFTTLGVAAAAEEAAECSSSGETTGGVCKDPGGDAKTYTNPIITDANHELADPGFLDDRARTGLFYIYPTGDQSSIHVYSSSDMVHWTKGPKAIEFSWPCLPMSPLFGPWYASCNWAPDVYYDPDSKRYYMYYSRCVTIGVAVADSPMGPFTDLRLLIRNWAIDAHMFRDTDTRMYLYYGSFNLLQAFSSFEHVWVRPMENATHFEKGSKPTKVLWPSDPWERRGGIGLLPFAGINEGPWMEKIGDTYHLMYSGANADSEFYALGVATAKSPLGPFVKAESNPITVSAPQVFGPGHHAAWRDDAGQLWCIYHIKKSAAAGWDRVLSLDPIDFLADGTMRISTSLGEQRPAPHIAS